MRGPLPCFVDTGAWITLALTADPYHEQAKKKWEGLIESGAKAFTSIPVIIESFTFFARNTDLRTALLWKDEVEILKFLTILECTKRDLRESWRWFERKNLYKLSSVDATSFTLMTRHKIKRAFTFDTHFSSAGFQII